jgi:hypothetical protein
MASMRGSEMMFRNLAMSCSLAKLIVSDNIQELRPCWLVQCGCRHRARANLRQPVPR